MTSSGALLGKNILVTRPTEQAETLTRLIRAAGGVPFVFPAIEITPPSHPARLEEILARLDQYDLAIFISPTAVNRTWQQLGASRRWPEKLGVAAVGQGSARALQERGCGNVIAPSGQSDSEALLALPALQDVAGKRVVIFRGEGGRELLGQTLARRGARVEHAECYRRSKPAADITPLVRQHGLQQFSAMILTSREGAANLHEMLGMAWDRFTPVPAFVPHPRIAEFLKELGMRNVQVVAGGDAGMVQAMVKFFQ